MPEAKLPHVLLNPAHEPLYSLISRSVVDALPPELKSRVSEDELLRAAGDAFSAFYVGWPVVRRRPLDSALLEALRRTLNYISATDEFRKAHSNTAYSVPKSLAYAAALFYDVLWRLLLIPDPNSAPQYIIDNVARNAATAMRERCKDGSLEKMAAELEELAKLLEHSQQWRRGQQPRQPQQGQHQQNRGAGVGGREAGDQPGTLGTIAKIAVLAVTRGLEQILILGGDIEAKFRFYRGARREARRGEPNGYGITRNPAKALPREHALPDELWYAKLASGSWLKRRYVQEKLGMLVIAIDKSGSMAGDKTVWARSVAYALVKLALKRRQPVALMFFDLSVWGPWSNPSEIIEKLLSVPSDGGTCIDCALRESLRLLDMHRDRTNTIVVITDGEAGVSVTVDEFKRRSARLVAVMIHGFNDDLEQIARSTGGQYMRAELDEKGALKVVDAAL